MLNFTTIVNHNVYFSQDLKSNNYLEVYAALTALCHLLNKDMIPAVFELVEEALSHPK